MTPDELAGVLRLINGADEAQVRSIFDAGNRRAKNIRAEAADLNAATLAVGDTVVLANLKPKYLNGLRAIVKSRISGKFRVEVVEADQFQLGRYGRDLTVPASCLVKT